MYFVAGAPIGIVARDGNGTSMSPELCARPPEHLCIVAS
jgi:hypothetical protein